MNYSNEVGLRGGGGCCKNKNKNKIMAINSIDDEENFNYEDNYDPEFSTSNNYFVEELEEFQGIKDEEEEAGWNVIQDDSFTMLTGKYESMNPDCLEDEDNEEDDFLEQYLLSMSPIIDKKTKDQDEKGNKGTTSRTVPRRPHDVSVKCSNSTEEIIGTPSEVALRLNDAIQRYLPRRKIKIEKEVSEESAVALDEEFEKEPKEESVENLCPDEEPKSIQESRECPGTYDRLRKENVSCADALTLREIALGRRIRRPNFVLPTEDQSTQPIARTNEIGEKDNCCCSKKKKQDTRKYSPPPPKSCCTKQPGNNKSVSFSF